MMMRKAHMIFLNCCLLRKWWKLFAISLIHVQHSGNLQTNQCGMILCILLPTSLNSPPKWLIKGDWNPELKQFIAMQYCMAFVKLPSLKDYWSKKCCFFNVDLVVTGKNLENRTIVIDCGYTTLGLVQNLVKIGFQVVGTIKKYSNLPKEIRKMPKFQEPARRREGI